MNKVADKKEHFQEKPDNMAFLAQDMLDISEESQVDYAWARLGRPHEETDLENIHVDQLGLGY